MAAAPSPATIRRYARALRVVQSRRGLPAPTEYEPWVRALFPRYVSHPFGTRHDELWEWLWAIEYESEPRAFVGIWPRGGGKTTTAELGVTALGVRGKRKYAWYVNETQEKADLNVQNIAALLESAAVARHYPSHSERLLGKFGDSRGWRRNRLRTAGGFTVDALGLDTAARGLKIEEQRPDLIILDDVDGKHDTLVTTAKKFATITTSILPAGSSNVAVLAVQNLIIPSGFFSRLSDGRADFMVDRVVSGPHPAIEGLETKVVEDPSGITHAVITGGEPTWLGQGIEQCQRLMDLVGLSAFLKECQHKVKELAEGIVLRFNPAKHMKAWTDEEIKAGIADGNLEPFGGIDYGHWRFAFLLFVIDRAGRVHVIDELFSQREDLAVRAEKIDAILLKYGIENLRVYGDPANPTDAREFNAALRRGWERADGTRKPRWRVAAAIKEKGSRTTGPERLNDMLTQTALLVRRGLGHRQRWNLGMNASSGGEPQVGSRFLWELGEWSYADPLEGRAQKQDPNDDSADGADMMAALRYGIMSWLKAAKVKKPKKPLPRNRDFGLEKIVQQIAEENGLRRGVG